MRGAVTRQTTDRLRDRPGAVFFAVESGNLKRGIRGRKGDAALFRLRFGGLDGADGAALGIGIHAAASRAAEKGRGAVGKRAASPFLLLGAGNYELGTGVGADVSVLGGTITLQAGRLTLPSLEGQSQWANCNIHAAGSIEGSMGISQSRVDLDGNLTILGDLDTRIGLDNTSVYLHGYVFNGLITVGVQTRRSISIRDGSIVHLQGGRIDGYTLNGGSIEDN